jgi:cation transport ATPase/YHS domain-containing protein
MTVAPSLRAHELNSPLKDPVCGMTVTVQSKHFLDHKGQPVYFCSASCKEKFAADPVKYLDKVSSMVPPRRAVQGAESSKTDSPVAITAFEPVAAGAIYTCPMHPEVRQDRPGVCPKCGMALEPLMPTLEEGENPELTDFKRRFIWTLPLTVVVTVLAMAGHRLQWFEMATQSWIELVLSLPIVLWAGWPFFVRGAQSVINRSPNMWTLIGLGTGAAFAYSVVATLAPGVFPASFVAMGRVAVYFEAAAVIISLTLLGQILELKARSQTSAAIKSLLGLAPKTARRINADGTEEDVALTHVHVGNTLRVRPGEKVPVDGVMTEGKPKFDSVVGSPGYTEDEVLRLAASLDQGSEHPLGDAIVNAAKERKLALDKVDGFESSTGIGVRGSVGGKALALGNTALMSQLSVAVEPLTTQAEALRASGASVMFLAVDGQSAGLLAVSDPIKASTEEALASLKAAGIRVIMATGDGLTTAKAVASKLGIDEVHGEVKPADKLKMVSKLQREGCVVAMAGTASTTLRRWPRPTWVWPWAQAPTWP